MLANSMVYSRFRYWLFSMMPSETVNAYLRSDIRQLLWKGDPEFKATERGTEAAGAPPFIKSTAAILPFGKGGVGALDWAAHTKAIRTHWVLRYLDPTQANWKLVLDHWIWQHPPGRSGLLTIEGGRSAAARLPSHPLLGAGIAT